MQAIAKSSAAVGDATRARESAGFDREMYVTRYIAVLERHRCYISHVVLIDFYFRLGTTYIFFVLAGVATRRFAHGSGNVLAGRHIRASESILVSEILFGQDKHRPPIRFPSTALALRKNRSDPKPLSKFLGGKSHSERSNNRVTFAFG